MRLEIFKGVLLLCPSMSQWLSVMIVLKFIVLWKEDMKGSMNIMDSLTLMEKIITNTP